MSKQFLHAGAGGKRIDGGESRQYVADLPNVGRVTL